MDSSQGLGFLHGQVDLLKVSIMARSSQPSESCKIRKMSDESYSLPDFARRGRSAKELRRSNQYDGSALSLLLADTECLFGRYESDDSWCIGRIDNATASTPLDRVGRYHTPTARALTMMRARTIASTAARNDVVEHTIGIDKEPEASNHFLCTKRRLITAPAARSAFSANPRELPKTASPSFLHHQRFLQHQTSMKQTLIDNTTHGGALQVGGGAHRPLAEIDGRITAAIASSVGLEEHAVVIKTSITEMMESVRWQYKRAVARACVEYELLHRRPPLGVLGCSLDEDLHQNSFCEGADSSAAAAHEASNNARLAARNAAASTAGLVCSPLMTERITHSSPQPSSLSPAPIDPNAHWIDSRFHRLTWRVHRQTGVSRSRLQLSYVQLEEELCVIERVQTDLQRLWLLGVRESQSLTPDSKIKLMCPDVSPAMPARQKLLSFLSSRDTEKSSTVMHPAYCEMLLTDVGSSDFCRRLPMTLGAFSAHIVSRTASALDVLRTRWLCQASGSLTDSTYFALQSEKRNHNDRRATHEQNFAVTGMKQKSENPDMSKALKSRRIELEGVPRDIDTSIAKMNMMGCTETLNDDNGMEIRASRLSRTCDAAVVLMSRQLRVLCESSLRAFAAFFNSFDATGSSRLSVFQLQLLLNKVTDDSSRDQKNIPRDIVRLDPSLAELNIQADVAIDCLIASMRGLPQPGATGRTSESPRPPKLHICGVAHDDELVSQTRACVHKALSHHFQGLLKLVARFDSFRSLLDGTVEA